MSDIARNAFDLEGKVIGTIGAGRIGYRVLQRLVAFDPKELLYYDYAPLPEGSSQSYFFGVKNANILIATIAEAAKAVNARRVDDLKDFVSQVPLLPLTFKNLA